METPGGQVDVPLGHGETATAHALKRRWRPQHVAVLAGVYLLVVHAAIFLVDVARVVPLGAWLAANTAQPLLWFHIFNEKGPTELLQWGMLAACALVATRTSGRLHVAGEREAARFWLLIGITAVILVIEDAATVRHVLAHFVMAIVGVEGRHPVRTLTELTYYAAIASVPVYAVVRYWRVPWYSGSRNWLIAGSAAYGVAAVASASRDIGAWYVRLGSWLDASTGGHLGAGFVQRLPDRPVGFYITDFIFEESLELLAAAFLLTAILLYSHPRDTARNTGGGASPAQSLD